MKLVEKILSSKNSLVFGIGKSGIAAAQLLLKLGSSIILIDESSSAAVNKRLGDNDREKLNLLTASGVSILFEATEEKVFELIKTDSIKLDLLVKSPGVSPSNKIILSFKGLTTVIGELELALLVSQHSLPKSGLCIVTGSNGKSTTVTLIYNLLKNRGLDVYLGGNIGKPFSEVALEILAKNLPTDFSPYFVVEASSYQLADSVEFIPKVAVFLNLSPNHLERHGDLESYFQAKFKPFLRQGVSDTAIFSDKLFIEQLTKRHLRSKIQIFSTRSYPDLPTDLKGAKWLSSLIYGAGERYPRHLIAEGYNMPEPILLDLSLFPLKGRHNLANVAASLSAVSALGIAISEDDVKSLQDVHPLDFRFNEYLDSSGRIWINDSKSTTPEATHTAVKTTIANWPNKKIILFIGGAIKANTNWEDLISYIYKYRAHFSEIIFFGASALEIESLFYRKCNFLPSATLNFKNSLFLRDALEYCKEIHDINSIALISPGCTSFDEFEDFEDRGRFIKSFVTN
jgi:UDP-N-acetylmuramoylalanine--D-glutamate ligase